MAHKDHRLASFLTEVANWTWEDFCRAEYDPQYTSNEAVIFAVIRACAMEKLDAIKIALNRIDGKLKTPVRVEYPKIFYLFPNASLEQDIIDKQMEEHNSREKNLRHLPGGVTISKGVELIPAPEIPEVEDIDLPSLSLRQTVAAMADEPRVIPEAVIEYSTQVQQWLKSDGRAPIPDENPMVKSVVAAHLLHLAQQRNINALTEVFDQIDGKLVETIQLLGEDLFIVSYSLTAPDGAYLNDNGVLQLEAKQAQDTWAAKLAVK